MSFRFPPEIEDEIFKIVVRTRPYMPADAHLAVVSKRVQSCIESILYESVMLSRGKENDYKTIKLIHEKDFTLVLHSRPASFFKKNVKLLFVSSTVSEKFLFDVLAICSQVHHLAVQKSLWHIPGLWDLIIAMPLRSLQYGDFEGIIDKLLESPHELSNLNYLSITHSDLDDDLITNVGVMKYLPEITHFSIRLGNCNSVVGKNLKTVLDNFPRLQSLIVYLDAYFSWGNKELDDEIRKWMEMDQRVQVIDSPQLLHQLWKEKVVTGSNDFEGCEFQGYHSEEEIEDDEDSSEPDPYHDEECEESYEYERDASYEDYYQVSDLEEEDEVDYF